MLDDATVELAFLVPQIASASREMASAVIDGPYGGFVLTPDLKDAGYARGREQGYVDGLYFAIDLIQDQISYVDLTTKQVKALQCVRDIIVVVATGEVPEDAPEESNTVQTFLDALFGNTRVAAAR